ncbi:MAG TPA: hypothetical protein VFQ91_03950 [Bryobacteraceae bacterium]|nr:hypothetical protein [Bryobacteraceae bacterium]
MRIRLRTPGEEENKSGDERPGTLAAWFRGLFGIGSSSASASAQEAAAPCMLFDKRWASRGKSKYLPLGRLCTRGKGHWEAEYLFDIHANGKRQQIRVVLPEPPVSAWEKARDKRMPEAVRLQIVRSTLETLLDLERIPTAITITNADIEAVEKEG